MKRFLSIGLILISSCQLKFHKKIKKEITTPVKVQDSVSVRNDPEVKCVVEIHYSSEDYTLRVFGWSHGDIIYSSFIYGNFDYIKDHKLSEIKKCEDVIYGDKIKQLQDLK